MSTFAVGLLLWLGATLLLAGAWVGGRSLANRLFGLPAPRGEGASALPLRGYGGVVLGPLAGYLTCCTVTLVAVIVFGVSKSTLVVNILPGSPAEHAGMLSGDRIVSIDGGPVQTWEEALAILQSKPAQTVRVAVNRSSEVVLVVATTNERGRLGLESQYEQAHADLAFALRYALTHPAWIVTDTLRGLSQWIIGSQRVEVVGISKLGNNASKGSSGGARLSLFAFVSAYLWPGVWLLEATFWWARRVRPIVATSFKLASRWRRLLAAVIDASLLALFTLIGGVVAVPLSRSEAGLTASTLLVALAWLTVQWLLVWRTGQSIGKRWAKIRISREDGSPARFARIILVRSWVVPLVGFLGPLGGVILFSDPLAIWRRDRRCLHDIWAGTIVIDS